jgi:hypothetical protein
VGVLLRLDTPHRSVVHCVLSKREHGKFATGELLVDAVNEREVPVCPGDAGFYYL